MQSKQKYFTFVSNALDIYIIRGVARPRLVLGKIMPPSGIMMTNDEVSKIGYSGYTQPIFVLYTW